MVGRRARAWWGAPCECTGCPAVATTTQEIAKALHNADIVTVGNLLMVAPRRYYHWGRLTPLSSPAVRART